MKHLNLKKTVCFLVGITVITLGCSKQDSKTSDNDNNDENNKDSTTVASWDQKADLSVHTLVDNFWDQDKNYWRTNTKEDNFAYWTGAHATDVMIAAYNRTGRHKYKSIIDDWYSGVLNEMKTFENDFYDDMEWNALALLRAYKATNESRYKEAFDDLWDIIKGGWSDVGGGGIIWQKNDPNGKAAIANAPASILASMSYEITEEKNDLDWAKKIFNWEREHLVDTSRGAVWDNLKVVSDGSIKVKKDEGWIFTYNQGTYLGAALKLYQNTGEGKYLDYAVKAANFTLKNLINKEDNLLKDNGDGDGGLFNGIFVRYLTQLILEKDLEDSSREYYIQFLEHNAQILLSSGQNENNLYGSYWGQEPDSGKNVDQSTQTSGTILIESVARLSNKGMLDK